MRHVFIINPVAGKTDAGERMLPLIEQAAAKAGVPVETVQTEGPKHATALARQYAGQGGPVRLYAVGGDGTLNEVFAGAYSCPEAEVACVPCGSGNDFIRYFGTAADFLDIAQQLAGTAVPIDLIGMDEGIAIAITSTGLDAEVAHNIPKYRRLPLVGGGMAYNISIVEQILRPLGKQLRVEIDETTMEGRYLIVAVCNARNYGGGFHAAPVAEIDDGLLDVILVKKLSRLLIASIIGKYKKGLHFVDGEIAPKLRKYVQHIKARQVQVTPQGNEAFILNVDGETAPAQQLRARVLPKAGRFVLPASLLAAYRHDKAK